MENLQNYINELKEATTQLYQLFPSIDKKINLLQFYRDKYLDADGRINDVCDESKIKRIIDLRNENIRMMIKINNLFDKVIRAIDCPQFGLMKVPYFHELSDNYKRMIGLNIEVIEKFRKSVLSLNTSELYFQMESIC